MIKGRPLFERLIIKDLKEPDKTAGGVLLPEQVKDVPNKGIIIKIGHTALLDKDGKWNDTLLKEGSVVLYTKYSGIPFDYKGVDYKIIMINEIIFVYEEEDSKLILADYGMSEYELIEAPKKLL